MLLVFRKNIVSLIGLPILTLRSKLTLPQRASSGSIVVSVKVTQGSGSKSLVLASDIRVLKPTDVILCYV